MRGYGQTDRAATVDGHNITLTVGDVVGIMKVAGETSGAVRPFAYSLASARAPAQGVPNL
jgi:hypothetical protein